MRRVFRTLLFVVAASAASGAFAEEACKTQQLKNPAPTLSEIYAMAAGYAKAWKADAVPVRVGNTSLGPLQPNGSSAAWNLMFYSDAAKAHVSVTTFRGALTCWADPGQAGRIPDLKPDSFATAPNSTRWPSSTAKHFSPRVT